MEDFDECFFAFLSKSVNLTTLSSLNVLDLEPLNNVRVLQPPVYRVLPSCTFTCNQTDLLSILWAGHSAEISVILAV